MVVALVRQIDTHYLVGFFAAPNLATLSHLVQDGYRPFECEFAEIPTAGVFCGNPFSYDVRLPLPEIPDHEPAPFEAEWPHSFRVFDAAEPTECLAAAMSDPDLVWHPLEELAA